MAARVCLRLRSTATTSKYVTRTDFSAIASDVALVIRRFLKLKAWRDTARLAIGGGFRASRVGELVIGRAGVLLKSDKVALDLVPIRNDPNAAGLIGAAHLVPSWVLKGHDAILAADLGGTNFRAGVVELNLKRASNLSKASVWKLDQWRHVDDKPARDDAVERLIKMLRKLPNLAPFIGIGCPGV